MMTWYLWRLFYGALPQHPLFWYHFDFMRPASAGQQRNTLHRLGRLMAVLIMPLVVWLLFVPLFVLLPAFLLFAATYGGALAAFSISRQATREREAGRYDQIAVTPPGDFGLAWALAARVLRRQPNLMQFQRLMRAIHGILFLTLLAVGVVNIVFLSADRALLLESGLPVLLIAVVFMGLLRLDLIQARLIGTLAGMLSPTVLRRADAPLLAVSLTLLLQFSLYLVVAIFANAIRQMLSVDADLLWNTEGFLLLLLLTLGIVFTIHEVILLGMWRILADRLNFNPQLLRTTDRYGA